MSNPGSQPLYWSLAPKALPWPADTTSQDTPVAGNNWLSASPTSGVLTPGQRTSIQVIVHSYDLLPGVYTLLLSLTSARQALDSPQALAVSLTVQPACRLAPSTGNLSFTTVSGQHHPPGQFISLGLTSGCARATPWQTFSSSSWLMVTPGSGQLWNTGSTLADIEVDTRTIRQGSYSGFIVFTTPQSSQTVAVQLLILPISASASQVAAAQATSSAGQATPSTTQATSQAAQPPVMQVSPAALSFSVTQGGANPPAQLVTVSASGGSISWQASITTTGAHWLSVAPALGSMSGGQSQQMAVHVDITGLAPGSYSAQIAVTATSAAGQAVQGASQTIEVSLSILRPCDLLLTPTSLSFTSSVLQPDPPAQSVTLKEEGDCARPVSWSASPDAGSGWLQVSPTAGLDNGPGSSITVTINAQGKLLGHYSGQITLTATDNTGAQVQSSPQIISVTLTVVG